MRPLWSFLIVDRPLGLLAQFALSDRREMISVFADLATFAAYAVIPLLIVWSILQRMRVHFSRVWFLLVAYLIVGGAVNVFASFGYSAASWTAAMKVTLAFISWIWVVVLIPLLPQLLETRSAEEFTRLVSKHEQAE